MNKRPGHVVVTTEVAMCSFCGRPRTLRNEQHQLGSLVRTIVTCETCHRTLSSTMSVAESADAVADEVAATPEKAAETTATPATKAAAPKPRAATSTKKAAAPKSRTVKKTK